VGGGWQSGLVLRRRVAVFPEKRRRERSGVETLAVSRDRRSDTGKLFAVHVEADGGVSEVRAGRWTARGRL